ncbi:MAG: hypothetical protein JNL74_21095 [Fibrobacteres bacterium]|nr:hypothetical protein [Fibrobacterota bacterium]
MKLSIAFMLFAFSFLFSLPQFTELPSITRGASDWTIRFAVSESTDVEVTVLKASDSSIVRRLTAGRLGSNPPAPLIANSLSQTISWDGRDELGNTTQASTPLIVRVRAGMNVRPAGFVQVNTNYFSRYTGAAFDNNGNLMIWGVYGLLTSNSGMTDNFGSNMTVRQFNSNGDYIKTLFPYPARQQSAPLLPWRIYRRPDSTYAPAYFGFNIPCLVIYGSLITMWGDNNSAYFMLPFAVDNKACFYGSDSFALLNNQSAVEAALFPSNGKMSIAGVPNSCQSHDGRNWFMTTGTTAYILKKNGALGGTSVWKTFDAADTMGLTEGLAFDKTGKIYMTDRNRNRICVFDTTSWTKTSVISVANPYRVNIDTATGALYVLSRDGAGNLAINKLLPPYQSIAYTVSGAGSMTNVTAGCQQFLLTTAAPKPIVALTFNNVRMYRDDGDKFTLVKDFNAATNTIRNGSQPNMYERVAVDRRNDRVFTSNGNNSMYRIKDWSTGSVVRCTSSTRSVINGAEMAVGPDGCLYVHTGGYTGPIYKFQSADYPVPSNFGTATTNLVDTSVEGRHGPCYGDKGITVRKDGAVACIPRASNGGYYVRILDPLNPRTSRNIDSGLVFPLANHGVWMTPSLNVPCNVSNVKFDFDGNIYVGSSLTTPNHKLPKGFVMTPSYYYKNITVGGIYKFPPTGGSFDRFAATGATQTYSEGLSIFGGGSNMVGVGCICRSPRFDLDPWGRLFVPNALICEVAVVDNAGNRLQTFGEYGNSDSDPNYIAFATPMVAASSDNYIYITDPNCARLLRVRMEFELDNIPTLSPAVISAERTLYTISEDKLSLQSSPNPFNPMSRITINLPVKGSASLSVMNAAGKVIKKTATGILSPGIHELFWDGKDDKGKPVAAGIYFYILESANKRVLHKTILVR